MMEKLVAILIAGISNHLWRLLMIEIRVARSRMDINERIAEFKKHVEDIEKSTHEDDDLKNKRLDNSARTLLYGVRKRTLP